MVSAIETHDYWPDPSADVREILRVLKPGGCLVLIAETCRGRRFDALYRPTMKLLRATYLTEDGHRELLSAAGFTEVEVSVEASKGWICAVGRRPAHAMPARAIGVSPARARGPFRSADCFARHVAPRVAKSLLACPAASREGGASGREVA